MPLIICTVFFLILFSLEGAFYLSRAACREDELDRYQSIEHPRRRTGDCYLDILDESLTIPLSFS